MRIWIGGLVLAGAAAVLFIGCGQDQEETIDIGVVDQQPSTKEGLSLFSKRRRSSGPPPGPFVTELPDDFPEDVPMYEGCEVINVNAPLGAKLKMVLLRTTDDIEHVIEFYNNSTVESGWEQQSFMMPSSTAMMSYKKEGNRTLSLLLHPFEGGTNIHITMRVGPSYLQRPGPEAGGLSEPGH